MVTILLIIMTSKPHAVTMLTYSGLDFIDHYDIQGSSYDRFINVLTREVIIINWCDLTKCRCGCFTGLDFNPWDISCLD